MKRPIVWLTSLLMVWLLTGCDKLAEQADQDWATPTTVTSSKDSLVGGVNVYKWHDTIITLQGLDDKSAKCFLMDRDSKSWSEVRLNGIPNGYFWAEPDINQPGDRVMFEQGYTENDQLVMKVLIGQMTAAENVLVRTIQEKQWLTDKSTFFAVNQSDVKLNDPGKRDFPHLGIGVINDTDLYIPFCLDGRVVTYFGQSVRIERGPFEDGVFHSLDGGMVWQMERITDLEAMSPAMYQSKHYYYYFVTGRNNKTGRELELWFSRKPVEGGAWETPRQVTKTFAKELGCYVSVAENDTVHVCWMDRRHNKWRFDLSGPAIENDDIYYSHRKDSDSNWSKDVLLSKGIEYCYAPSISAEGDKVVVTWAGIPSAGRYHTDYDPNDIYYVTSKDGGNTWTKPLRVTDGAKDGMTAGHPQVMLLNGVIHLFYIQGKMDLQQFGGMTKVNQPPWPIYYTQRPFPN
ncbi:MAG TPA: sialidase family protein [Verrucomicrobiae bacterium]|nr:sialidase family protein [Verrucomicrobiae bacterium]